MSTRKQGTKYDSLVRFLNTIAEGEIVTRKDLFKAVYGPDQTNWPYSGRVDVIDKWRRELMTLGYLRESPKPGRYYKIADVPEDLTTTKLEDLYMRTNATMWKLGFK